MLEVRRFKVKRDEYAREAGVGGGLEQIGLVHVDDLHPLDFGEPTLNQTNPSGSSLIISPINRMNSTNK